MHYMEIARPRPGPLSCGARLDAYHVCGSQMDSGKTERIQRYVRIRSIAQAAPPPVRHVPGRSTPRPFMDVSVEPRSHNTDLRKSVVVRMTLRART